METSGQSAGDCRLGEKLRDCMANVIRANKKRRDSRVICRYVQKTPNPGWEYGERRCPTSERRSTTGLLGNKIRAATEDRPLCTSCSANGLDEQISWMSPHVFHVKAKTYEDLACRSGIEMSHGQSGFQLLSL